MTDRDTSGSFEDNNIEDVGTTTPGIGGPAADFSDITADADADLTRGTTGSGAAHSSLSPDVGGGLTGGGREAGGGTVGGGVAGGGGGIGDVGGGTTSNDAADLAGGPNRSADDVGGGRSS